MAFTQTDLDALQKAYKSGVLTVRQGDRTVTYDSEDALRRRIEFVRSELARDAGTRRPRVFRTQYGKGL